ncbi:hypothetical protein B4N84_21745 [Flavobacterium sp. IR1]|nr:hypothetical protein B4N84_21745 [Flavobacterium sp. IR1]
MKKYLILLITFITSIAYSQRCGGGTFEFEFYTLNIEEREKLQYEILNFDNDWLIKQNYDRATYARFVRNYQDGIIVKSNMVNEIETDENTEDLVKLLDRRGIDKKGYIDNGVLKFQTAETYWEPYVLKISNTKVTFFILANLFGNCSRTTKVVVKKHPEIIK